MSPRRTNDVVRNDVCVSLNLRWQHKAALLKRVFSLNFNLSEL